MTDNNSTMSPTATPNKCQQLEAGDIAIFSVTSDDPDIIALFPLVDVYPEVDALYITDNPWNGTHLLTTESTIQIKVPPEGFFMGKMFGYGDAIKYGDNWTIVDDAEGGDSAIFDVSRRGDQLFLYCKAADDTPHFLWALSLNGPWRPKGLNATVYGVNTSALPDSLSTVGNVALEHCDNVIWLDPSPGQRVNKTVQVQKLMNPEDYKCDDINRLPITQSTAAPSVSLATTCMVAVMATLLVTWRK